METSPWNGQILSVNVALALSLSFVLSNMASLARYFSWHLKGELDVQLGFFFVVFVVGEFLYRKDRKALYAVVACYFVATVSVILLESTPADAGLSQSPDGERPKAVGVTNGNQSSADEHHHRIRPADLP